MARLGPLMPAAGSALLVVLLGVWIYGATLSFPFVYDDQPNITQNGEIRVGGTRGWGDLGLWRPTPRPVSNLSFALNYAWGGYAVEGYRWVNVLVHVLTSLLVALLTWQVLRRCEDLPSQWGMSLGSGCRLWLALFSGLLFVSHPLSTQSVVYVVQRMTSLAVLFYVGGLCAWIGARGFVGGSRFSLRFLACVLGLLSLGSKEIGATFPLAILLWELGFEGSGSWSDVRRLLPWSLILAGGLFLLFWGYAGSSPLSGYSSKPFTLWERVWTEPRVWWRYVDLSFFPHASRLSLIHDVEMSSGPFTPWTTWVSWLGWAGLLGLGWLFRVRFRLLSALIVWWLLQQQVEGSFLPLEPMYEHRTYLPLVGLCAVLPWLCWRGLSGALGARWGGVASVCLGLVVVGALASEASARAQVWRDPVVLWQDALEKAPRHPRPWVNLGMARARAGDHLAAIELYDQGVVLDGNFQEGHHNRAVSLQSLGRNDDAVRSFRRALTLYPGDRLAHEALAQSLLALDQRARAFEHLEVAARLGADPRVHFQLGWLFAQEGRAAEAVRWLEAARRRAPEHRGVALVYAQTLAALGEIERARASLQAFAVGDGRVALLRARLAWALGEWAVAVEDAEAALRGRRDWRPAVATLAWMLIVAPDPGLRDPERAFTVMRQGIGASEHPNALEVRALEAAQRGRFEEAAALASRAALITRDLGTEDYARSLEAQAEEYRAQGVFVETVSSARQRVDGGGWASPPFPGGQQGRTRAVPRRK